MMYLCTFYVKDRVGKHTTVSRETVAMCSNCATITIPDFYVPTSRNCICVRCGIKNFSRESVING